MLTTTEKTGDDPLCRIAERMSIQVFRGSENDLNDSIKLR